MAVREDPRVLAKAVLWTKVSGTLQIAMDPTQKELYEKGLRQGFQLETVNMSSVSGLQDPLEHLARHTSSTVVATFVPPPTLDPSYYPHTTCFVHPLSLIAKFFTALYPLVQLTTVALF